MLETQVGQSFDGLVARQYVCRKLSKLVDVRHFICPIIQQYAHLHRYDFRRAGQQGPTRTLTAGLERVIKQLLGTYSITQVKYYKREN